MITFSRALVMFVVGMCLTFCSPQRLVAQLFLGDVDGDADVDNFDLMIILDNQGDSVLGDVDVDGDTDAGDYQIATFGFMPFSSSFGNSVGLPATASSAKLIYNATNGALSLDQTGAPGGVLSAFLLQSNGAFNILNPVNYPFGTVPQNLAKHAGGLLAQADHAAATSPPGLPVNHWILGNLLPPGLDLAGLDALSLRGVYTGVVTNQPAAGRHLQTFQVVVIPEPSAVSLALTAVVVSVRAGRRR